MPVCCRCNGSGHCMSCFCVKSDRPCVDCLPSRKGYCCNIALAPVSISVVDDEPCTSSHPSIDTLVITNRDNVVDSQDALNIFTAESGGANASAIMDGGVNEINTAITSMDVTQTLPLFKSVSRMSSSWGDVSENEFTKAIDSAYAQVVHWRPNLFKVPSGACGKQFVAELTRLFNAFAQESDLDAIALKAAMTLPSLMLQKPHAKSKTHEHISCLWRKLSLWEKGGITNLLKEGRVLQRSLVNSQSSRRHTADVGLTARRFSKMILEGCVRAALKFLSNNSDIGLLSLDETVEETSGKTVRDILNDKHPEPKASTFGSSTRRYRQ